MSMAPTFAILELSCYERPVTMRLPFRFGAVTVTHAPQAFVRARIRLDDGREAWGAAAELMVPKWFDKSPAVTEAQSFDQLRQSLRAACDVYTADKSERTAFGHFAAHYSALIADGERVGLPALAAGFGPAEVDKALLDALARALDVSFYDLVQRNLAGIAPVTLLPEFRGFDMDDFLATLAPRDAIALRHTVGMLDVIAEAAQAVNDGLPESLEQAVATYGLRFFKIKLSGDIDADIARLESIAALLDVMLPQYTITLDGNEQYDDVRAVAALWERISSTRALDRLRRSVEFLEQPVHRAHALERSVAAIGDQVPMIIDESDATLDAFVRARELGYRGVSSKACKGAYKSLINRARCARWNAEAGEARWFMSGEDLTTQAGLAVQQDVALASLLGFTHVERNGHHYVHGFGGQRAPGGEQEAFLAAHPDLYERNHAGTRLSIHDGALSIGSLACVGFASRAQPDWESMSPLAVPTRI